MDEQDDLSEQSSRRRSPAGDTDRIADTTSPRNRDRLREQRARARAARRRRFWLVTSIVVIFVVVVAVAAGVFVSRNRSAGKAEKSPAPAAASARPSATSRPSAFTSQPVSGTRGARSPPVAGAGGGGQSYFWVTFEPPRPVEKLSEVEPPTVAIVVDDTGNILDPMPRWLAIDAPLTFSAMPYPPLSKDLAFKLHQAGYRIMMHVPTQNAPPNSFSGKGQLAVNMDSTTVFKTLDDDLASVPFAKGLNNHQGGLGCDDLTLMTRMCQWAKQKGMYVVDSSSSARDKVSLACTALGMPHRKNEVFIDHQNDPNYIRNAMRQLAELAKKNGTAIGICHWHRPNTPTVVGEMIRQLKNEGIHFAFVQDVTN